jgi:hypothetical protein
VTTETDSDNINLKEILDQVKGNQLMTVLITSAVVAKRIQSSTKFGTAVIDLDLALPPKIKMSFSKLTTDRKDPAEPYIEGLDPACSQANSGK